MKGTFTPTYRVKVPFIRLGIEQERLSCRRQLPPTLVLAGPSAVRLAVPLRLHRGAARAPGRLAWP